MASTVGMLVGFLMGFLSLGLIYDVLGDWLIDNVLGDWLDFLFLGIVPGIGVGVLQWLVLRGKVSRAGWWVLASTVGWGLSMAVSRVIAWGINDDESLVPLVVTGAVLGAVTGGALVWLLRQPAPEA